MAGYEDFPRPDDRLEGSPGQRRRILAETISALAGQYGVDAGIAEAYKLEASQLYVYPGIGPALADHLDEAKLATVLDFQDLHAEAFGSHFESPEMQEVMQLLRHDLAVGGQDVSDDRLLALMIHGTPFGEFLDYAERENHFGLRRNPLVRSIIEANYLHYFGLLPIEDMVIRDDGVLGEVSDFAFGGTRPQTFLFASEVATRLRKHGVVDLSREHLDERRASLHAIAQLAATVAILSELSYLPIIAPETGARTAADLARTYEGALKADDLDGKIVAASAVAATLRQHEQRLRNRSSRRLVHGIARDAETVAHDLPVMRDLFLTVYRSLGYEPPERRRTGVVAKQTGTAAVAAQTSEPAVEALPDEADVRTRAADLSSQWRLTSRERRTLGFAEMQQALVTGELTTGNGVQHITAVPKEQARQLVDVLGRLYDRAARQSPADAVVHVDRALEEQRTLVDAARKLGEVARTTRRPFGPVEVVPLDTLLAVLRANWPEYRQVVRSTWPQGRGGDAVRALDAVLSRSDGPPDTAPL